jgi:CheY-like chemotaxis protein
MASRRHTHGLQAEDSLRALIAAPLENPQMRIVPIVVLTSSAEDPDLRTVYELGANS